MQLYLLCSLILCTCYVAGTWVLCSNSLLGIVWTTNNGLLKGKDQGTMHYDCCRTSWYVCTDIMVAIYRQDSFFMI